MELDLVHGGNGVTVTTDTITVNAPPPFVVVVALLNPDLFRRGWSGVGKVMFMLNENSVLVSR